MPQAEQIDGVPIRRSMCRTCPFQTNGEALQVTETQEAQLKKYLSEGQTHICHTGQINYRQHGQRAAFKTCRGGVEYAASLGILTEADRNDRRVAAEEKRQKTLKRGRGRAG